MITDENFDIDTLKSFCDFSSAESYKTLYPKGYKHTRRLNIDNHLYDYEYIVLNFMKYRGCTILGTNYNFFGGFYIYYTAPTNNNTLDEFLKEYKEPYFKIPLWFPVKTLLGLFILIILLLLVTHYKYL